MLFHLFRDVGDFGLFVCVFVCVCACVRVFVIFGSHFDSSKWCLGACPVLCCQFLMQSMALLLWFSIPRISMIVILGDLVGDDVARLEDLRYYIMIYVNQRLATMFTPVSWLVLSPSLSQPRNLGLVLNLLVFVSYEGYSKLRGSCYKRQWAGEGGGQGVDIKIRYPHLGGECLKFSKKGHYFCW